MKSIKGAVIASAVASMFMVSAHAADKAKAPAKDAKVMAKTVKCAGGNECKGKGACSGADNSCAGNNGCKGKGWVKSDTEKDCMAKGGKVMAEK